MPFKAKNGLLAIIIVLSTLSMAYAQGEMETLKHYSMTEIRQIQEKSPKKLIVDVYTDWCSWCKKMDKNTYLNQAIIKQLNEDFYFIKLKCYGFVRLLAMVLPGLGISFTRKTNPQLFSIRYTVC